MKAASADGEMRVPRRGGSSRQARPGFFRRWSAALRDLFSFKHPVFFLSVILSGFVAVFVLLVSGVIGRTITRIEVAVDWAAADAGFAITTVHVTGAVHVPQDVVLAQMDAGRSIFTVSPLATRYRLLQLDWIKSVEVRRRYPGTIEIAVVERKPFARWQPIDGGETVLIERDGARITANGVDRYAALPLVIGDGAGAAAAPILEAVRRHPAIARHVRAVRYCAERRWDLILDDGRAVKLPEYLWQHQLDEFERLIVKQDVLQYRTGEIDLRNDTHLIFDSVPNVKSEEKKVEGKAI